MQSAVANAWGIPFLPPQIQGAAPIGISHFPGSATSGKPRVGLGVICRCIPQKYSVECLLLKRGPKFVSPLKWSFPGGRLDEDGEIDDDGEKCTIKELKKECGGGTPDGLPPLIHIECYKSGRTLYHVFVIDCEAQPDWLRWNPSVTSEHTGEIDPTPEELVLQGKQFPASNGFCWIDLQTLIEECMGISINDPERMNSSDLQHGLIRWVKSNGENILKTLMARSPKLAHHRRYSSTGCSSIATNKGGGAQGTRPRSGSTGSRTRKLPQDNHMFSLPMLPGQQAYHPTEAHFPTTPGGTPLIQVPPPMGGAFPDIHKHPHSTGDPSSQVQTTVGDSAHFYHPSVAGSVLNNGGNPVYVPQGQSEVTTPPQAPQHSPLKSVVNEENKVGTFSPYEGSNLDGGDVQSFQHHPYAGGMLTTMFGAQVMASDNPHMFDPTIFQNQQIQQPPLSAPQGGSQGMEMNPQPVHAEQPRYVHHRRNEICRNYLAQGHCPYGEKCWFVHPDQKPHREPLLGPGGILTSPMSVAPQPGMFPPSGPGMGVDQYFPQYSSPKSPLGGGGGSGPQGAVSPTWQLPAAMTNRPSIFPFVRGGFMGGAQPQVLLRPFLYQNRFISPANDQIVAIPDPILFFRLLSEGMIRDSTDSLVADITSLSVRADHFYVSFEKVLRDYRVLFGATDKLYDSHFLSTEQVLNCGITCLHVSKINTSLLVIGTTGEGIFTLDLKRNGNTGPLTTLHEPEQDSDTMVTALVHFTTVAGAQVVVAGNSKGEVTWHIAQPPMKTFSVLAYQKDHVPNPVVCLQIFGGCLVSGSNNGKVCLWNMRTQQPILADSFQAHSESLLNIHVLDTTSFVTVGLNQDVTAAAAQTPGHSVSDRQEMTGRIKPEGTPIGTSPQEPTVEEKMDSLTTGVNSLSLGSSSRSPSYSVSLWEYSKPMKNLKTLDGLGSVVCSAFHQQPLFGNRFLALGLTGGAVKIYNLPSFSIASEIHFQDIANRHCRHIALNLSREKEHTHNFNMKNPFRDLILTTVWSDGRIMVCQIDPRRNS